MLELGTRAPDFRLPDTTGKMVSLSDADGAKAVLVMFICNHCPFVKHIRQGLARFAKDYQGTGLAIFAINANDASKYPEDSPAKMTLEVERVGYVFPYLFDETQQVAKSYRAACTPEFYLFDTKRRLAYRGQFDASRPENGLPVTGADLRAAVDAVLAGKSVPSEQQPSIGCNIKWKKGNEPTY